MVKVLGFESALRQLIRSEVTAGLRTAMQPERRPAKAVTRCACGCGKVVAAGNRYVKWHHLRAINAARKAG
jgi:hypothetical protein